MQSVSVFWCSGPCNRLNFTPTCTCVYIIPVSRRHSGSRSEERTMCPRGDEDAIPPAPAELHVLLATPSNTVPLARRRTMLWATARNGSSSDSAVRVVDTALRRSSNFRRNRESIKYCCFRSCQAKAARGAVRRRAAHDT